MSETKKAYLEAQRIADDKARHVLQLLAQFAELQRLKQANQHK